MGDRGDDKERFARGDVAGDVGEGRGRGEYFSEFRNRIKLALILFAQSRGLFLEEEESKFRYYLGKKSTFT